MQALALSLTIHLALEYEWLRHHERPVWRSFEALDGCVAPAHADRMKAGNFVRGRRHIEGREKYVELAPPRSRAPTVTALHNWRAVHRHDWPEAESPRLRQHLRAFALALIQARAVIRNDLEYETTHA